MCYYWKQNQPTDVWRYKVLKIDNLLMVVKTTPENEDIKCTKFRLLPKKVIDTSQGIWDPKSSQTLDKSQKKCGNFHSHISYRGEINNHPFDCVKVISGNNYKSLLIHLCCWKKWTLIFMWLILSWRLWISTQMQLN